MAMVSDHHRPRPHRLLLDANTTEAPSNGSRTRNSYTNEANFDTNMVIILAALLCALICALGLNSIVRCAFRCSRRFSFETGGGTASRLAATGLKKSALRKLPVTVYGSESGLGIRETDCPICLGDFIAGEKIKVLPKCNHGFHVRCIDTWLASHSSCPTCRQSLFEQQSASESTEADAGNRPAGNSSASGQGEISIPIDQIS
ncbi:RING-H2 finger protein ATL74-like [Cucurbita moschata]|uniref:RING-type E3 ubiquitin transferase n=1 Tax=Cucurbita moschata TaxID=3662 RepID=A0A6J1FF16_CUCMO|nr:RING-H2 finger protein ATL74-like [Cucurbita moschata]